MAAPAAPAAAAPSFEESIAVLAILLLVTLFLFFQGTPAFRQKLLQAASPAQPPSRKLSTVIGGGSSSDGGVTSTPLSAASSSSSSSSAGGRATTQTPPPPNPKTAVLVVDDDPVTRLQLGTRLKKRGFTVTEVCDGKEAVELYAKGFRFCLVVMDYEMPELNGVETITQIRRRDQNAIIIGSTIHDASTQQRKFLRAGANKVARTKPITDEEIDELVREYELI